MESPKQAIMTLKALNANDTVVTINTSSGSFVVELFNAKAPTTTANFLKYVNANFYTDTLFHRVIDNFVIQGGGYTLTGPTTIPISKSTLAPITLESRTGLSNTRGTIAMARTNTADSATSQFYINVVDNTALDYRGPTSPGYAVFGTVIAGMSIVDAISKAPVTDIANSVLSSIPYPFITINSIKHTRLDTDGVSGQAYRIYKAAFDRIPDTTGLGYWIAQMDKGMDVVEVAARFIDSNEFRDLYGANVSSADFLTKVYSNVLDRVPDTAGLNWWVSEMSTNPSKTWQKVLADFSESTENQANVASLISNGVIYDLWQ
jgi:cyclophilin family peptidyl-prolyl cis-trans isomerase